MSQPKSIRKRDGRIVPFNKEKIADAVFKALSATNNPDKKKAEKVSRQVVGAISVIYKDDRTPTVENIQDLVERMLIEDGYVEAAKAYILYRNQHAGLRETKALLSDAVGMVDKYLGKEDWRVRENSNMSYSLQGLNNHIFSLITSSYWLSKLYPQVVKNAHLSGDFHIHDIGVLSVYCCGWDMKDLLARGYAGAMGKVEASPPKHFRTALGQIVNFFYTLQGEAAGAQAFSNFDTLLAPFIRYDSLSYKDVKQAMQEFIFNMNIPTRVGFQTPFTNITMDITPPKTLAQEAVIIHGMPQSATYSEFRKEMMMINKAFCEVMMEGDSRGRVFTFPIPTYNITKDFDWENENLLPLWEMTAKYGIPYFSNFINSDMDPEDARSMCLHGDEEIVIKNKGKIERTTIKELIETYGGDEWQKCKEDIEVISINDNYKIEWARIKNFLKTKLQGAIKIKTKDGKFCKFSKNHPVIILNEEGLKQKMAKEIEPGDYMISLKDASGILSLDYEKMGDFILDENLAFFLGFFTADGNFLYKSKTRKLSGLQFTFNLRNAILKEKIKAIIKEKFDCEVKEKKDPRYNTYYLYIYKSWFADLIYSCGFKKYGRVSNSVFNSPKRVIEKFLEGFFAGSGYEKRKEMHIKDTLLIRDLTILYSLIGIPNILKLNEKGQRLYLQHKLNPENINNQPVNCLAETDLSIRLKNGDIYPISVVEIEKTENIEDFYDIELEKNHKFVHSLGTITHNCCRLRLDNRELKKRGGGLFGSNPLTGSIGVVTINLPAAAYTKKDEEGFRQKIGELMDIAKQSLEIKRKVLERFTEDGLYPYAKHYLSAIKDGFGAYWKNHFSTIGIVGMNEACLNLLGKDISTSEGKELAISTLRFIRDKITEYQQETGNLYNIEATPAEGATHRLAMLDKERYPDIIAGGDGKPYYTNSTHLPVNLTDDLFFALSHQDELQSLYTGGTVFHGFVGEKIDNAGMCKVLIKKISENFSLPYFTITPTFSICPIHGYVNGEHFDCPISAGNGRCGMKCEVYSRIVGYYRPVQQWNDGKQQEFAERKEYLV